MFTLNCKGRMLVVDRPLIMGIINVTPDSFYEGSRFMDMDAVLSQAEKMLNEGADIIDIGAQSSRPGSAFLTADEELSRVADIIHSLHTHFPEAIFSVDTFYSRVARECVLAGASIINDISAGQLDEEMLSTAGTLGVPYVCMHMRGTPQTMNSQTDYENVTREVLDFLAIKTRQCHEAGIRDLIIDPGFGFSKTIDQNFQLLKQLSRFKILGKPILIGFSRKSSVYKTLGITAAESLNGTSVMNTIGLMNGANILRVHDVKEAKQCITLFEKMVYA